MTTTARPRAARRSADQTREHVLAVAQRLFYWEGIHATGVDRVAQQAGVAPTALYRVFGSKDALVAAYVSANAAGYREFIAAQTAPEHGSAQQRILRLFDAVLVQVQPEICRGCPFLMTLGEFPDPAHEAHRIAVETKQWVRTHLRRLVDELAQESAAPAEAGDMTGAHDPSLQPVAVDEAAAEELTDQLSLVLEGMYASVQALGADGPPAAARSAAEVLTTSFVARSAS